MIGLPVFLDIAIGLFFIYLTLSLLASEIQELFAGFWQWRAKHLKKSIYRMLSGVNNGREIEAALKIEYQQENAELPNLKDEKDKTKAKTAKTIVEFIHRIYSHQEIASLSQSSLGFISKNKNQYGPSYIPASAFAIAFIDVLTSELKTTSEPENSDGDSIADRNTSFLNKLINHNPKKSINPNANDNPKYYFETFFLDLPKLESYLSMMVKKIFVAEGISVKEKIDDKFFQQFPFFMTQFQGAIEDWFKYSQDRTSGTYKRNSKIVLFCVGLLAALLANANTFQIVENLHDEDIRETVVARAVETIDECQDESPNDIEPSVCTDKVNKKISAALEANQLPLGWFDVVDNQPETDRQPKTDNQPESDNEPETDNQLNIPKIIIYDIPGIVITAFAIMMGAPFWFDLLKKVVNVRNAGPKPRSSDSADEKAKTNNV